ncbi:DNA topoisomerase 3 [gut metagenome]|uniref:DNA topoisomerase 3 n=1 Tax=gut metagenome TaxID=749906 RepID=J9GHA6_9ZZZZ
MEETGLQDQRLPMRQQGEKLKIERVSLNTGKTKPPARFTEATLLAAMENPVKYMETRDARAVKTLGETGGLGTVATRADIIEKLFHTFLMEKKGNEIYITSKAKQLLELVPSDLKKPELTADWERKLSDIAKGKMKQESFLKEIEGYTCEIVKEIKTGDGTFRHDNLTNKICPQCGKRLLAVNGKNSKMLVCQDRECGYRETISRTTNARCPKCHKRMELLVKGKEETFVCSCGYKEKLSAFQARRQKEGAGVNKREVQRYLKQQQKEANEPVNNAFAQALAGLKLDQ